MFLIQRHLVEKESNVERLYDEIHSVQTKISLVENELREKDLSIEKQTKDLEDIVKNHKKEVGEIKRE